MTVFTDTAAGRVFLVTLEPYDPVTGATVTLYAGTDGIVTEPTDTPADTFFEPIVKEALTFERSMFRPGHVGGRSLPDRGNLELVNTGAFDAWLDYHWEGRAVTVRMGRKGDAFAGFAVVFSGICGAPAYERNTIVIPIRDKQEELDTLLQETLYAGSGGNEGGDDLKNKPKPVCLGRCLSWTACSRPTKSAWIKRRSWSAWRRSRASFRRPSTRSRRNTAPYSSPAGGRSSAGYAAPASPGLSSGIPSSSGW